MSTRVARGGRRRRRKVLLTAREQARDVDARAVNVALPIIINRSVAAAAAAAAVLLQCDRIRSGSDCTHKKERHCRADRTWVNESFEQFRRQFRRSHGRRQQLKS
jgi:hypothetical protein